MGLFERNVMNGFDSMFDINHDGKLGPGEQAMQFAFMDEIIALFQSLEINMCQILE